MSNVFGDHDLYWLLKSSFLRDTSDWLPMAAQVAL